MSETMDGLHVLLHQMRTTYISTPLRNLRDTDHAPLASGTTYYGYLRKVDSEQNRKDT